MFFFKLNTLFFATFKSIMRTMNLTLLTCLSVMDFGTKFEFEIALRNASMLFFEMLFDRRRKASSRSYPRSILIQLNGKKRKQKTSQ